MWADALLIAERGHVLRLGLWAATSVLAGLLLFGWLALRRVQAPFIRNFAIQMFAWGTVDLVIAAFAFQGLAMRDYASAMRMQQFLWLNAGLDVGYAAVGATLAIAGWRIGQSLSAVGAGVGVIVQGFALFVLDIRLLTIMSSTQ